MKSISIKNFKNLKDLNVDSLSKVNLIVGMNNSGKSTLLEAISILAANGDVAQIKEILEIRGLVTRFHSNEENVEEKELLNFSTLYTGMDVESFKINPIKIFANYSGSEIEVVVKLVDIVEERIPDTIGATTLRRRILGEDEDDLLDIVNITKGVSIAVNNNLTQIYPFKNYRSRLVGYDKRFPCEYVQTTNISSKDNPSYYDKIALSELEKELIFALNIIDDKIDAINFLKNTEYKTMYREENRIPMVVYKGSRKRYYLSTMGDGINRILTIILAMLNCKNGILLVDEFDNGLHHSVQTKLWKMIYRLANSLNIQVFATTHSDDCIKSFIEADPSSDGKLIRLENRNGDIVCVEYDEKDELEYIFKSDIEVR